MGIDYSVKLIVGWLIDCDKLIEYLKSNGAHSCKKDRQCLCGESCWNAKGFSFSGGFIFYAYSQPYYNGDDKDTRHFLAVNKDDTELESGQIQAYLYYIDSHPELQELAEKLGAEDEANVYAELHVS